MELSERIFASFFRFNIWLSGFFLVSVFALQKVTTLAKPCSFLAPLASFQLLPILDNFSCFIYLCFQGLFVW